MTRIFVLFWQGAVQTNVTNWCSSYYWLARILDRTTNNLYVYGGNFNFERRALGEEVQKYSVEV